MTDFTKLNCDNHSLVYVNQIITLYTLDLYSAVCQLHLSKTGRKKKRCSHPELLIQICNRMAEPEEESDTYQNHKNILKNYKP